ncbi:retrotransposon protein [Tanacetum coccineum]
MLVIVKVEAMKTYMKNKKPKLLICWLRTSVSSFAVVIGLDAEIVLAMVVIDSEKAAIIALGNKGGESSKPKGACYNCAWSDSEDGVEQLNDATWLMAIDSQEEQPKGQGCRWSFTKEDCDINKNGKTLAKGHRRNGLYTCKLGDNSKQQICLAFVVDNSTLWHRRLGHANMRLVQYLASNELVRNLPKLSFERHFCDTCGLGSQGHSQTSKAYIVLNKETIRIGESLNVTFDGSLPEPKSSPSIEDDRINEPIVQDLNGSPSLQVNFSDEGYPKSLKEAKGHPIKQVIGELNEKTLRSNTKQA